VQNVHPSPLEARPAKRKHRADVVRLLPRANFNLDRTKQENAAGARRYQTAHSPGKRLIAGTVGWEPITHPKIIEKIDVFARTFRGFVARFVFENSLDEVDQTLASRSFGKPTSD
jgi:hypothetical protein